MSTISIIQSRSSTTQHLEATLQHHIKQYKGVRWYWYKIGTFSEYEAYLSAKPTDLTFIIISNSEPSWLVSKTKDEEMTFLLISGTSKKNRLVYNFPNIDYLIDLSSCDINTKTCNHEALILSSLMKGVLASSMPCYDLADWKIMNSRASTLIVDTEINDNGLIFNERNIRILNSHIGNADAIIAHYDCTTIEDISLSLYDNVINSLRYHVQSKTALLACGTLAFRKKIKNRNNVQLVIFYL